VRQSLGLGEVSFTAPQSFSRSLQPIPAQSHAQFIPAQGIMNLLPLGNLVFGVHGDGLDRNVSYMPFLAFSPQQRKVLQFMGGAPLIIFRPTDPGRQRSQ
jgi:hypothetical protein